MFRLLNDDLNLPVAVPSFFGLWAVQRCCLQLLLVFNFCEMKMKIQCLVLLLCAGVKGWAQNDSLLLLQHEGQIEELRAWQEQSASSMADMQSEADELQMTLSSLRESVDALNETVASVASQSAKARQLGDDNAMLLRSIDTRLTSFTEKQGEINAQNDEEWNKVSGSLDAVETAVSETESNLLSEASRLDAELSAQGKSTTLGIAGSVLLLVVASLALWKLIQSSSKRTQKSVADDIELSKKRMAEQMIELDQKLAEALTGASVQGTSSDDHSLALKVADEVTRIESNLSQMDSGVRGHKQLSKSVVNVKNNLQASGYEVVEMLGKPYNEGMIVEADFTLDENLDEGQRIITRIRKPEVRFNGEVIQVGKVTVSQG